MVDEFERVADLYETTAMEGHERIEGVRDLILKTAAEIEDEDPGRAEWLRGLATDYTAHLHAIVDQISDSAQDLRAASTGCGSPNEHEDGDR